MKIILSIHSRFVDIESCSSGCIGFSGTRKFGTGSGSDGVIESGGVRFIDGGLTSTISATVADSRFGGISNIL